LHGPEKKPEPNRTQPIATRPPVAVAHFQTDCGCRLPVALNQKYSKTGNKPVAIGCNRFIIIYIISTYIHTFTPVITIYMNNKLIKVSIIIIIAQINVQWDKPRGKQPFRGSLYTPVAAHGPWSCGFLSFRISQLLLTSYFPCHNHNKPTQHLPSTTTITTTAAQTKKAQETRRCLLGHR
jgi:hypothetical protein